MSMVLTRSPLEPIGMNGAGVQKRRSARLSNEGAEETEPPNKKAKVNGVQTTTVSTKEQDGEVKVVAQRRQKVYDQEDGGFAFAKKGRRSKEQKQSAVRNSTAERQSPPPAPAQPNGPVRSSTPTEDAAHKAVPKKPRRRFPTTPEREAVEKPVRRSKRLSNEHTASDPQPSSHRPSHARSHANTEHSPSPDKARPVTVEKKRKKGADGLEEEEKIMRIQLPFQDTPIIRRNKEMRKGSAEGQNRRSSSGMRGRRASSLIDEGRGNALPHAEVSTAEFFKHISTDLTEPRRMRCLLGWCGNRALPSKPEAPKDSTSASNLEFQILQAARVIQEELSQVLTSDGTLSDWFSRDEAAPPVVPLRKKPNPRNVANTAKAEELERELKRLRRERAEWDELISSAAPPAKAGAAAEAQLSPVHAELLDSPQREILEHLHAPTADSSTDAGALQQRLRLISEKLEFSVDQFAYGIHALQTTRETAERLADRTLSDAAKAFEEREKARRADGKTVDSFDALRALGKVLNPQHR